MSNPTYNTDINKSHRKDMHECAAKECGQCTTLQAHGDVHDSEGRVLTVNREGILPKQFVYYKSK